MWSLLAIDKASNETGITFWQHLNERHQPVSSDLLPHHQPSNQPNKDNTHRRQNQKWKTRKRSELITINILVTASWEAKRDRTEWIKARLTKRRLQITPFNGPTLSINWLGNKCCLPKQTQIQIQIHYSIFSFQTSTSTCWIWIWKPRQPTSYLPQSLLGQFNLLLSHLLQSQHTEN